MNRAAAAEQLAPVIGWSDFLGSFRSTWQRGEHVSVVGPTGQGKTTVALELLPIRPYSLVIATKPKDSTLIGLTKRRRHERYRIVRDFADHPPAELVPRQLLWPKWNTSADTARQQRVVAEALDGVFAEGGWCVFVDELYYLTEILGLKTMLRLLWQQGRSLGISLVGATQRPAWVPLELYSQATHVLLFRHNDRRDLDRLSGIASAGDVDPATIRQLCSSLGKNQFLYVNTRTGDLLRSRAEL